MFVLKSKYQKLEIENTKLQQELSILKLTNTRLSADNNEKRKSINGYLEIIESIKDCILCKKDVAKLIVMVQPDKHQNELKFVEITKTLIALREAMNAFLVKYPLT